MELIIDEAFSVCKVRDLKQINLEADCCFTARTDEELSVVCRTDYVLKKEADFGRAVHVLEEPGYKLSDKVIHATTEGRRKKSHALYPVCE